MQSNNNSQNRRRELGALNSVLNCPLPDTTDKENAKCSRPDSGELSTTSSSTNSDSMADPMAQLTDLVTDLTGVVREVKEGFTNLAKDVKEVKNDVKALKNGSGATIAATPLATLLHRDMQIVDDTATLRDAIVGVRGSGSGTFSFMKRTDKDGKRTDKDGKKIIEYLVVTCAHCCLEYKMSGKMQFVTIPKELAGMVEGVYILKEYYSFGASYKKNRKHDIILLKLSKFSEYVKLVFEPEKTNHDIDFCQGKKALTRMIHPTEINHQIKSQNSRKSLVNAQSWDLFSFSQHMARLGQPSPDEQTLLATEALCTHTRTPHERAREEKGMNATVDFSDGIFGSLTGSADHKGPGF